MAIAASASGRSLPSGAGALTFERDGATDPYRISSGGAPLTESGDRTVLAEADGSASQLWRVSACEGNRVWLYVHNGAADQAWLLADLALPAADRVETA